MNLSPAAIVACAAGILLGVVLTLFAVFSRKKVPAYFTVILIVVGILSILSPVLLMIGIGTI